MQNIIVAADGGGTSLRLIAFGEDLKLAAESCSGPVNPNFEDVEKIKNNMTEAARLLLAGLDGDCKITGIYATIVGSVELFERIFRREAGARAEDAELHHISEAHSHLYAASLQTAGGVALAGTGSGAMYCSKGETVHLGGYGIPVGDEGSGAWIGLQGMSAAVKYISGWGEKTALADRLYEYLNADPPGRLTGALYGKDVNQRNLFAGFCRHVAECERAGDVAARGIIYSAGKNMGLQMIAALKAAERRSMLDPGEAPIIYASGGAWKGTPYMFEAMETTIRGVYPGAVCRRGIFDPVMSGVIKFIFDKTGRNTVSDDYMEQLKKEFKDYEVKIT